MWKERNFVILLLFLVFQIPLVLFFKNQPFEEKKWQVLICETLLVTGAVCFMLSKKKPLKRAPLRQVPVIESPQAPPPVPIKKEEDTLFHDYKNQLEKELISYKERVSTLEKELLSLKMAHEALLEEKEKEDSSQKEVEEAVTLLQEMLKKTQRALFDEIEEQQEMRRRHMIEIRALLRKESMLPSKEGSPTPEKKNVLASVPRGTTDPSVLLLLAIVFAEKLKTLHQHDQNGPFLIRRKLFEELKAIRPLSLMCLSVDNPADSLIPQPMYQPEEAQKLLEWIRQRLARFDWAGGGTPILATLPSTRDKWLVVRLDKPFFNDLFLCVKVA